MKKVLKLNLILLMFFCIMGNVYAALSSNVNIKTDKTDLKKGEEFTVNVELINVKSEIGVISLGTTLEYDKNSLELKEMTGKNGWETPTEGTSYNEENGKIAITRSGLGKKDETVFSLTFKVKEKSKKEVNLALKDIVIADGTQPVKIKVIEKKMTINENVQDEQKKETPQEINNQLLEDSKKDDEVINEDKSIINSSEKTEDYEAKTKKRFKTIIVIMILIISAMVIHIINRTFSKQKKINKKERKIMSSQRNITKKEISKRKHKEKILKSNLIQDRNLEGNIIRNKVSKNNITKRKASKSNISRRIPNKNNKKTKKKLFNFRRARHG